MLYVIDAEHLMKEALGITSYVAYNSVECTFQVRVLDKETFQDGARKQNPH